VPAVSEAEENGWGGFAEAAPQPNLVPSLQVSSQEGEPAAIAAPDVAALSPTLVTPRAEEAAEGRGDFDSATVSVEPEPRFLYLSLTFIFKISHVIFLEVCQVFFILFFSFSHLILGFVSLVRSFVVVPTITIIIMLLLFF